MKALSFRPPWGYLCATVKDIENRYWPLPKNFVLPQRIYIHQSRTWDDRFHMPLHLRSSIASHINTLGAIYFSYSERGRQKSNKYAPDTLAIIWGIGAIVGEVDITGCIHATDIGHHTSHSPWFVGPYGFILRNAVLYEHPIPCKGKLGFFNVTSTKEEGR